jgi:hypothetical protein
VSCSDQKPDQKQTKTQNTKQTNKNPTNTGGARYRRWDLDIAGGDVMGCLVSSRIAVGDTAGTEISIVIEECIVCLFDWIQDSFLISFPKIYTRRPWRAIRPTSRHHKERVTGMLDPG